MSVHFRYAFRVLLSLSVFSLVSDSQNLFGQAHSDEFTLGTPWTGAAGVQVSTEELMRRQQHQAPSARHSHRHLRADFQNLRPAPESPDVVAWPVTNSGTTATPQSPQATDINFTAATLADTEMSFPPDTMGVAGPSQFIIALNGRIRSFNKTTGVADGAININSDIFFQPVLNPGLTNNFTSDPRIRYDHLSRRWFITMIDVPGFAGTLVNHVLLAVSDSSVITASSMWTLFSFQQDQVSPTGNTGNFADYPTLGIDVNALYVGVNIFSTGRNGTFSDTVIYVIRKSSVLGSGPIVATAFRGLITKSHGSVTGPYTPQGADNYDPSATEGYVIGVDAGAYGRLQLRRISNPGATPSISGNVTVTIPLNGSTIGVPHLGNNNGSMGYLDGLDYRLLLAHYRNGRLWTTENMAVDNTGSPSGTDTRMAVRWYELQGIPTGQTPSVRQSGTVYQPSSSNTSDQRSYWMGTAMVSGQGHVAMGFSVAGMNEYANAGTVGRLANDALGTMRTPLFYTASSSAYNPSGDTGSSSGRRWGDFSMTSLDPSDDMTMWTIQEFCDSPNSYGVQVVRLLAPPPAIPSSCSPAAVSNGLASTNVVVTGTTNGDTGFFDPGAGFSNRIAAAISGSGVAVNGVTYTDPTHVTLNLAVATGAPGGARFVTITNPDGQSQTSVTAILTVIGGPTNSPPSLTPISNRVIHQGSTLIITNSATDPDIPTNTLTYSLVSNALAGAAIDAVSGVFNWTPSPAYTDTTNPVTVKVTDNGSPPLSDSKSFTIAVLPRPAIGSVVHSNGFVMLTWSAISGQTYQVEYKVNLTDPAWSNLSPVVTASGPTASQTAAVGTAAQRFYRVQLAP